MVRVFLVAEGGEVQRWFWTLETCAEDGNVIACEAVTIFRLCAFEFALELWSGYDMGC